MMQMGCPLMCSLQVIKDQRTWSCQHHAWLHLPVSASGHAWHLDILQPQQDVAVQSYLAKLPGTTVTSVLLHMATNKIYGLSASKASACLVRLS